MSGRWEWREAVRHFTRGELVDDEGGEEIIECELCGFTQQSDSRICAT